jgi:hypothetical protein
MLKQKYYEIMFIILISSICILNQTISLGITEFFFDSKYLIWGCRFILLIMLINLLFFKFKISKNLTKFFIIFSIYSYIDIVNASNFSEFVSYLVRGTWLLLNFILIAVCLSGIKDTERKYSILVFVLILWGIVEIFLLATNIRFSFYLKYMIIPAYVSLAIVLFFRKKVILWIVSALLFIVLYAIDHNRSAVLALGLVFLALSPLYQFLKTKIVINMAFTATIIYTIISSFAEPDVEMQESFNTGRAQIWNFWLNQLFSSPVNLLLGLGSLSTEHVSRVIDLGNFSNGIDWLAQFHSAFIATFVYGGILKFSVLALIIFSLNRESVKDHFSLGLYYYALSMMTFNSMVPFFTPELYQFLFLLALLIPLTNNIEDRNFYTPIIK